MFWRLQNCCFFNHSNDALFSLENVILGAFITVMVLCNAYSKQLKLVLFHTALAL